MALPTLVKNPSEVKTGRGPIFVAPANPTIATPATYWTAASSKFSMNLPGYYSMGYTEAGITVTFGARDITTLTPAEEYEPIRIVTTGIGATTVSFSTYGV